MNKSILVTGISGSGKSFLSERLEKMGYNAHNIEDIKNLCYWINKKTNRKAKNYNTDDIKLVKQHDWICDKNKLKKLIRKNPRGIVFYCGIASNLDDLLPLFDKTFLLKVNQKVLRKRLSIRTSNKFGRTSEVQKMIFNWKNRWEKHMCEKGAIPINANHDIGKIVGDIIKKIK